MRTKTLIYVLLGLLLCKNIQIKAQKSDSLHVGFILANLYHERWWNDQAYFKEKLNELGGKVTFKDCFDMWDNQIKAAEEFIAMGVDAIVIVPVDARKTKKVVELAHANDIPVIAYDRLILGAKVDMYATVNSTTVGEMMARSVLDKMKKGNILYVGGPEEDFNSSFIHDGNFNLLDTTNQNFNIYKVHTSSWNQMDAYMVIQNFIMEKGFVPEAIICAADMLTYGAIEVLSGNDMLGKVYLTGQDAELEICKQVAKGNVLMTVYKSNRELAFASALATWKLMNKEEIKYDGYINNHLIDVPSILIPPVLVNKETLNDVVKKEGIYQDEVFFVTK